MARVRSVMRSSTCDGSRLYGRGVDVGEDGSCPDVRDGLGRRDERVRGRDHLVARTDVQRPQGELERGRAGAHTDGAGGSHVLGPGRLERAHLVAEDEAGVVEDALDRAIDLAPDRLVLSGEVNELDPHASPFVGQASARPILLDIGDLADDARGVPDHDRPVGDVVDDHAAGTHQGVAPDDHARQQGRVRTDLGAPPDDGPAQAGLGIPAERVARIGERRRTARSRRLPRSPSTRG